MFTQHKIIQFYQITSQQEKLKIEALEGVLENGGELRGRRLLVTPRSALLTAFKREESARRRGVGGRGCP